MRTWRCFDELVSVENIWRAWRAFERGKRRRPDVAAFSLEADRHVHRLAADLRAGRWRPRGYRLLRITDPKRRIIAAAPVIDRVVHHAIYRVLGPSRFDRRLVDHTYACLPDRGSHRAVLRFRASMRRWRFVMKLDIRRYFYSIDRAVLRALLFRNLPELRLRRLLDRLLESGATLYREPRVVSWLGWDEPVPVGRGLPIGNLTSQWWGNLYLDGLDHLAMRQLRVRGYQRYMDDFTLFSDSRDELGQWREQLAEWLLQERGLLLKDPAAGPVSTRRGVAYLGYRVSRRGITPGEKLRDRLPGKLRAKADDPEALRASLASVGAAWMFG